MAPVCASASVLDLRVKDLDFDRHQLVIRRGKGQKDRLTMLPAKAKTALEQHLAVVKTQHARDLERGVGRVVLPFALERKYPNAGTDWGWQYVFPGGARVPGRALGTAVPVSFTRVGHAARGGRGGTPGGHREAGELSYVSALLCHAFTGGRV